MYFIWYDTEYALFYSLGKLHFCVKRLQLQILKQNLCLNVLGKDLT